MNGNTLKNIGRAATVLGIGVGLVSSWVDDRKMDQLVEEKVNDALALKEIETEVEPE